MANKIKSEIKNNIEYEYFDIDALHGTDPTLSVKGMAADAEVVGKTIQGQPIAVVNSTDFSNQDLLYLYIGEEDGFEYGYVYAYVDGAWTAVTAYGRGDKGDTGDTGAKGDKGDTGNSGGALFSQTLDSDGMYINNMQTTNQEWNGGSY